MADTAVDTGGTVPQGNTRSRNWLLTINNFSSEEEELIKSLPNKYIIDKIFF